MPAWIRAAARRSPAHQFVRDLPSSAREGLRVFALTFDPVAIRADQRAQRALGIRRILQRAQRLHAEFDAGDVRRFHTFHRRMGHPFGMHPAAFAIGRFGAHGNVVADGVFRRVPVMQVGETLVPVVAVEAARVVARDEWLVRFYGHLDLEGESGVLHIVVLSGRPSIDDEQGNGASVETALLFLEPGLAEPGRQSRVRRSPARRTEPAFRLEPTPDRHRRSRHTVGGPRARIGAGLSLRFASPPGSSLTSTASLAVSSSGA